MERDDKTQNVAPKPKLLNPRTRKPRETRNPGPWDPLQASIQFSSLPMISAVALRHRSQAVRQVHDEEVFLDFETLMISPFILKQKLPDRGCGSQYKLP